MDYLRGYRKPVAEGDPSQYPPQRAPNSYGNPHPPSTQRSPGYSPNSFGGSSNSPYTAGQSYSDRYPEKGQDRLRQPRYPDNMPINLRVDRNGMGDFQYSNRAAVSFADFSPHEHRPPFNLLVGGIVLPAAQHEKCPQGNILLSEPQRQWLNASLLESFPVTRYEASAEGLQNYVLGSLDVTVSYSRPNRTIPEPLDQEQLQKKMISSFGKQILAPRARLMVDWNTVSLTLQVNKVQLTDLSMDSSVANEQADSADPRSRAPLTDQSLINFLPGSSPGPQLKASKSRPPPNAILAPKFKFTDMGIGGLDKEFMAIFRRAFASRIFPPEIIESMGIQHVKGMLLYGPPGTGKTLIARRIGEMLNARPPKVINGPEVLNKFVGQSEENIRKLFADAEREYKEKKDESGLHIIIFDELDAVCKQRGSGAGGGTGVGDSVVNQLLSKLDGVDQLNNILLIGMTNRMDMIDDALLRPGRLEVHMEISLPDEKGRVDILNIHTATMKNSDPKRLDNSVDLAILAQKTKNYSGAELAGLVRSATSFAMQRHVKAGSVATVDMETLKDLKVTKDDFDLALQDIQPAFGASQDTLSSYIRGELIPFAGIDAIQEAGKLIVKQVADEGSSPRFRALLWGSPGSGKTALAAKMAMDSDFPFMKIISPDDMIGFSEVMKKDHMRRIFEDAYKSPLSLIIVDDVESIIEWVRIGPRFSNPVLQALKSMLNKQPPPGHRLLVLATATQRHVMQELELYSSFDQKISVPTVNDYEDLEKIMMESHVFSDIPEAIKELTAVDSHRVGLGIKPILLAIDMAKQDRGGEGKRFANTVNAMRLDGEIV